MIYLFLLVSKCLSDVKLKLLMTLGVFCTVIYDNIIDI